MHRMHMACECTSSYQYLLTWPSWAENDIHEWKDFKAVSECLSKLLYNIGIKWNMMTLTNIGCFHRTSIIIVHWCSAMLARDVAREAYISSATLMLNNTADRTLKWSTDDRADKHLRQATTAAQVKHIVSYKY